MLRTRYSALEAKYLLKLMLGDMRIGVKQSLVEEAIAVSVGGGCCGGAACGDARSGLRRLRRSARLPGTLG